MIKCSTSDQQRSALLALYPSRKIHNYPISNTGGSRVGVGGGGTTSRRCCHLLTGSGLVADVFSGLDHQVAVDSLLQHHLLAARVELPVHAEHDVVALGAEPPAEQQTVIPAVIQTSGVASLLIH